MMEANQNGEVSVNCNGCGKTCYIPFVAADECGGSYVCSVCKNDAHPPEELNSDEAPVVQV